MNSSSLNIEQKEEAIPLLIFDPVKKIFTLSEQGEELIRSMKGEFAVISVAGMYRTGKSYLLNQMLLNRSKGFSVGPTVNPCTKGLWIWNKPILGLDTYTNTKIPILLIDTEGFGAFDEDQNHDIKIFTLSVLLSSYFIYNSMGSIDENAIQSLSFVINLSKSIQMKGKGDSDPEELSALFPSFLWLVRDFSLQLVDDDGDTITPKEYLEKVLDTSKSTYETDDKIKIRKLIKTFFKDRDCHTMVRPITDETKLQDLQNINSDKLRPDFVEGIIQLRKKISNKIKPKMLNKKALNGEMFINMIRSVIEAINTGAIPNIENTWSSMCKVECAKAVDLAEQAYEKYVTENLGDALQGFNSDEFIKNVHKAAKENSISIFKKKAIGESSEEYLIKLKLFFKERLNYFEEQSAEGNRVEMYKKLKQYFSYFENKLYNQKSSTEEDISIEKIDEELKKMEIKINERFGEFKLKNEIWNEFKANVFFFIGEWLKKSNNLQIEQHKKEREDQIKRQQEELEEVKTNGIKELKKKTNIVESLKTELYEEKEQNSNYKQKIASLEKDLEIANKNSDDKLGRIKDEYDRRMTELQKNLLIQDEKVRDAERKVIQIENEKSREVALLEQNLNHKNKQIEEFKKSEKESGVEMKSQLKEATSALKETTMKYEEKIKSLNLIIEKLKEDLVEEDANNKKIENALEIEKERADDLALKLKEIKEENENQLKLSKLKYDQQNSKFNEDLKNKLSEKEFQINKFKIQLEEQELKFKQNEEEIKEKLNSLHREYSLIIQQNGFLEEKNKDLKNQIDEQKKNYDSIIQKLEAKTFSMIGNDEYQKKLDEIKIFYENERLQSEESIETQKKFFQKQIEQLIESKNEIDIRSKAELDEKDKKTNELQTKYEKVLKELKGVQNEKKLLTDNLNETHEELNEKLKRLYGENEKKIEEKNFFHQKEMDELTKKSEETIKQLRLIFETEKIRLEEKLKEEKLKYEKKYKGMMNEFEEKLKESTEELHNEYLALEEEYKSLEQRSLNYESQAENEINLLNHKCETLEKSYKDTKEQFEQLQFNSKKELQIISDKIEKERKELIEKFDNLNIENNNKEKQILISKIEIERLGNSLKDKEDYINKLRQELEDEKKEFHNKMEESSKKYNIYHDNFLIEKLDLTKEIAVLNQQLDFSKKKIEELKTNSDQNQIKFEERLFSLRKEVENDFIEKLDKLKIEKADIEEKLINKKKDLKELEQSFVKQIGIMEKDIILLKEKLSNSERDRQLNLESYEKEISSISAFSKNLKGDHQKELEEIIKNAESQKEKILSLEIQLKEAKTSLEKDDLLFNNKIKYLENQKDNYKNELFEVQKKLNLSIENIQIKNQEEKEKIEKGYIEKITSLESKYNQQIKDLNDKHSLIYKELFENNKNLEKENKNIKLDLEIQAKALTNANNDKSFEDLNNQYEKLKMEFDNSKKTFSTKINDLKLQYEKERDEYRKKSYDLEIKLKEIESKRSNMVFDFELERGKWNNEKEHLLGSINELKENIDNLQIKNESLVKDNYKFKNEKALGKSKANIGTTGSSRLGTGISFVGGKSGNPYANIVSNIGSGLIKDKFGFGADKIDKILDPDVSGIQNDSLYGGNTQTINSSNKFNKYKNIDDSNFSDK